MASDMKRQQCQRICGGNQGRPSLMTENDLEQCVAVGMTTAGRNRKDPYYHTSVGRHHFLQPTSTLPRPISRNNFRGLCQANGASQSMRPVTETETSNGRGSLRLNLITNSCALFFFLILFVLWKQSAILRRDKQVAAVEHKVQRAPLFSKLSFLSSSLLKGYTPAGQ